MSNVLLVDNDADILELLSMGLEAEGHYVRTAASGVEALGLIEQDVPEFLVTDLIMPNIDGEKLIRIIQSTPAWNAIRTIVVSGVAMEAPDLRKRIPCHIYIAKGPIAQTLQYLRDSLRNFDRMAELSRDSALGTEGIYSRHVTRELLEATEDVGQILDEVSDGVCRVDPQLRLVWINEAFARLLNRPAEAVLGRALPEIFGDDAATSIQALIAQASTSTARERDLHLPDGRIARAVLLSGAGRTDTTTPGSAAYPAAATLLWQDITERLLLEEQYENIVESANDLIWTSDLDGRVTYVSRAATRVLGRDPSQLRGGLLWEAIGICAASDLKALIDNLLSNLGSDSVDSLSVSEWAYRTHADDLDERWLQLRISPLRDRGGRIMGLRGTVTDITAEQRLLRDKEALLHEVHHRVRDNLQLIASLARLSDPDLLESRIAALSEIFHELYQERSFSRVSARPIVERVANAAVQTHQYPVLADDRLSVAVKQLPMKTAVPLALVLNEVIHDVCRRMPPGQQDSLRLRFTDEGPAAPERYLLSVVSGSPEPGTTHQPFANGSMIQLLVEQIGAKGGYAETGGGLSYEIRFS